MFLFNKAISVYGNLLIHSLGFEGLITYSLQVVNRLGNIYKSQVYQGYRLPQTFNIEDQYDNYFLGCINSLIQLYQLLLHEFSRIMEVQQRNITSEKLNRVVEEVKGNLQNEAVKTLILVENSTVGLILSDMINLKVDNSSNKRGIQAKFYYSSSDIDEFNSDSSIP